MNKYYFSAPLLRDHATNRNLATLSPIIFAVLIFAEAFLTSGLLLKLQRKHCTTPLIGQEGGGGDHLSVAWQTPLQSRLVIDGQYLEPVISSP